MFSTTRRGAFGLEELEDVGAHFSADGSVVELLLFFWGAIQVLTILENG
jgi:hypothetical protein